MQGESNSVEEFELPEEWCKKQHRELAIRYNIIPKHVKKANFTLNQRMSLFLTHFSIKYTKRIALIFFIMVLISYITEEYLPGFRKLTNNLLDELAIVWWTAILLAFALNLTARYIQMKMRNGDYLFNKNPILVLNCKACKKKGITEDYNICKECNSLGVNIENWPLDVFSENLKNDRNWGMN